MCWLNGRPYPLRMVLDQGYSHAGDQRDDTTDDDAIRIGTLNSRRQWALTEYANIKRSKAPDTYVPGRTCLDCWCGKKCQAPIASPLIPSTEPHSRMDGSRSRGIAPVIPASWRRCPFNASWGVPNLP